MYHSTVDRIKQLLEKNNAWFETFEHEPVRTSEEAAQIRPQYSLSQGAKALIIEAKKDGEKFFVMLVVPGDKKFVSKKAQTVLNTKSLKFATPEDIARLTNGIVPGGVPPFGNIFNIQTIADKSLFNNEKIIFNAGDKSVSIAMRSEDYKKIVSPEVAEIC